MLPANLEEEGGTNCLFPVNAKGTGEPTLGEPGGLAIPAILEDALVGGDMGFVRSF